MWRAGDWVAHRVFGTTAYDLWLRGHRPARLRRELPDPFAGDPGNGARLLSGRFGFLGIALNGDGPPWSVAAPPADWLAEAHSFAWARDLRAAEDDGARRTLRDWIDAWLSAEDRWDPLAWRPDVLARRITAWLLHAEFFLAGADDDLRRRMAASLGRQVRHLGTVAPYADPGLPRVRAWTGVLAAALATADGARWRARAVRNLEAALRAHILPDGAPADRNPSHLMESLRQAILARTILTATGAEVPAGLRAAVDRGAPMLRFLRHGDGGLVPWHGGGETASRRVSETLKLSEAKGKAPLAARHGGLHRLIGGKLTVWVDTGPPPGRAMAGHGHAATLGIEVGVGKQRLITCCGPAPTDAPALALAVRGTAAHSTLTVGDRNSSALGPDGAVGPRLARISELKREDDPDGTALLTVAHDGYGDVGLTHRRRLHLDPAADVLRGEDAVIGPGLTTAAGTPVHVRFHLHPGVKASVVENGRAALLRPGRGAGWRLVVSGGVLGIEESIYLGRPGERRRTEQLVIATRLGTQPTSIKWALRRLEPA